MEEEGVTESYDDGSRVIMIVEEELMNDVHDDRSRAVGKVEKGLITIFTTAT